MPNLRAAAYIRVSTSDQDVQNQLPDVRQHIARVGWTLIETYADEGVSGKKASRPAFDRMMQDARDGKIDAIVTVKLDRIGRSVGHLYRIIEELRSLNVELICTSQDINTCTPTGKLLFAVLAAMAEFESDLISERTKTAMRVARDIRHKHVGRPVIQIDQEEVRRLRRSGLSIQATARQLGIAENTLRSRLSA
jgi:DNA invertase Pin-like site-specific DNA recombinase